MNPVIIYTLLTAGLIAAFAAVVLFFIARKFHVQEDPRIDEVANALPGVNCGGCGQPGCRAFAELCVKSSDMEGLFCPVGGNDTMANVANLLGRTVQAKAPVVAVLRCNGSLPNRPKHSRYDGPQSCAVVHALGRGETGCQYGCLWCGDCVKACKFGAMTLDKESGLPVIDEAKCVACGACVTACPRQLIQMRLKGPKNRRVYVSCVNKEKGNVAMKACRAACIGCSKCLKECPFGAITIQDSLAYIDDQKCKLCRKCVSVCPTGAIHEVNFPPKAETKERSTPTGT